jgi:hypothetical protein
MKETGHSRIFQFIHRYKRLAQSYEWLGEHWLMVVIYILIVAVVLCIVILSVAVFTT